MFEITGIDHVQLAGPVGCEETARAFFSGVLGMQEITKPASLAGRGGVWFQCGAQELHVGVQVGFVAAKKAHPAFGVRDIAALIESLKQAGLEMDHPPRLPKAKRIFVFDPFGNRIEFIERS